MSHAKPIPGFLGLEVPPRTEAPQRTRPKPVSMADLSPEEWRIVSMAECPKTRRTMADTILNSTSGAGKAPPCRAR
jgi:hypothetical protein